MSGDLASLQERIGYRFTDASLLMAALTHSSWAVEHPQDDHNQRLEFLGDSVLQLVLAEALFTLFPLDREGELTKRRALLIQGRFLCRLAREIGLGPCLRLGVGEEGAGGRNRDAALEDAFEALVGAINLDGGFGTARAVVLAIYGDLATRLGPMEDHANPKGRLQEIVQPLHGNKAVRYELLGAEGGDHEKRYEVAVYLLDRRLGSGRGTSKQRAEEEAARAALLTLAADPPAP
jgi:ribonuclease-3